MDPQRKLYPSCRALPFIGKSSYFEDISLLFAYNFPYKRIISPISDLSSDLGVENLPGYRLNRKTFASVCLNDYSNDYSDSEEP